MRIERIKLLKPFTVTAINKGFNDLVIPKGFILNCITDRYGAISVILPKNFGRDMSKRFGVDLNGVYGFKISERMCTKILERRYTKFIQKIRIDYLLAHEKGITFKYIK